MGSNMYRSYKDALIGSNKATTAQVTAESCSNKAQTESKMSAEEAEKATELLVEDEIKEEWEKNQQDLAKRVIIEDVDDWAKHRVTSKNAEQHPNVRPLQYIGGLDISFIKGDNVNACAAFVVLNYPKLEVVYEDLSMIKLTAPYIAGYLAFREADFLLEKIEKLRSTQPELTPQVILNDGNGILHPRKCGIACHIGVLTDIPQLGAAKNIFAVRGIKKAKEYETEFSQLEKAGDSFPLIDEHGETLGAALKAHNDSSNPIFVSPGHKLTVDTAVWVTHLCTKYRVPEPTRQADIRSREYLRVHFPTEKQLQHKRQPGKPKHHKTKSTKESADALDSTAKGSTSNKIKETAQSFEQPSDIGQSSASGP